MAPDCGTGCKVCCAVGCTLFALIIFLVSIATIEPIEYGIKYNSITKKTDEDNVYPGGWYAVGPFASFLTFPSTLVNIDWTDYSGAQRSPLTVRDNDGQDIRFAFSIQYRLTEDNIGKLYTKYKQNYESQFITWADQEVRNTVGKFNSSAFWSDRASSGEKMKEAINTKFVSEGNFA
jgi:hypothetical protein